MWMCIVLLCISEHRRSVRPPGDLRLHAACRVFGGQSRVLEAGVRTGWTRQHSTEPDLRRSGAGMRVKGEFCVGSASILWRVVRCSVQYCSETESVIFQLHGNDTPHCCERKHLIPTPHNRIYACSFQVAQINPSNLPRSI